MAQDNATNLSDQAKKVLKALAAQDTPLANKQIAQTADLPTKEVSDVVKKLKASGLVDSPARCKYGITPDGKSALGE